MSPDQINKPNSYMLIQAAKKLGIKVDLVDRENLRLKLSYGGKSHELTKKSLGINNSSSLALTRNKHKTSEILRNHHIQVPEEIVISSIQELNVSSLPPFPLVVKPLDGQKGAGVYIGIASFDQLAKLCDILCNQGQAVLIQSQAFGADYRVTILDAKIIGLSKRHPQVIVGDGENTIKQLIENQNYTIRLLNKTRDYHLQNSIAISDTLLWHLENQGKSLNSILNRDEIITPLPIANFQTGGWVETIDPQLLHPQTHAQLLEIASILKLKISGLDVLIKDIASPPQQNLTFIEINSDPSLRIHDRPNKGQSQNTNETLLRYIFSIN